MKLIVRAYFVGSVKAASPAPMILPNSQLPKPKLEEFYAAADQMRQFRNKGVLGRCMFWSGNCDKAPIGSHLLSRSWLQTVSCGTNHVIQIGLGIGSLGSKPAEIIPRRVGINTATTFPGFCEIHDNEVFGCLERRPFAATAEQIFALRYRSLCQEACSKHQMVSCHIQKGLSPDAHDLFTQQTVAEMRRCLLLLREKTQMEAPSHDGFKLMSLVVRLAKPPTVLVSATAFPLITFTGRALDYREEFLTFSVIPEKNGGWCVFTWRKDASTNPGLLVNSWLNLAINVQTKALLNLIFETSENHAISPPWWNSLSHERQQDLLRRFGRSFYMGDNRPPADTLINFERHGLNWEPQEHWFC